MQGETKAVIMSPLCLAHRSLTTWPLYILTTSVDAVPKVVIIMSFPRLLHVCIPVELYSNRIRCLENPRARDPVFGNFLGYTITTSCRWMLFRAWFGIAFVVFGVMPGCVVLLQLACALARHRRIIHPRRLAALNVKVHYGSSTECLDRGGDRDRLWQAQMRLVLFVSGFTAILAFWTYRRIMIINGALAFAARDVYCTI